MPSLTLFRSLPRKHGEWLAQGILAHALRMERGCRELIIKKCGFALGADDTPMVEEERPDERTGWRADLLVEWPAHRLVRIELKLRASLTRRQEEARSRGDIDLLVVPESRLHEATLLAIPTLTWAQFSATASPSSTIASLLAEVEADSSWFEESPEASTLLAEFEAYASAIPGARWPTLYRFLSSVDLMLKRMAPEYSPSAGWSASRGSYYGYAFSVAAAPTQPNAWWFGFSNESDEAGVCLALYRGGSRQRTWPLRASLSASAVTEELLLELSVR